MQPYEPPQDRYDREEPIPYPGPPATAHPGYPVNPAYGSQWPQQSAAPYPVRGYPPAGYPGQGHPPFGHPGPGHPPPWAWPASTRWPYGPDRPSIATAAAVLGFVTAGLTALAGVGFVIAFATGDGDLPTALLLLGVPCAVGELVGGLWLLRRRQRTLLVASSVAAAAVLVIAMIAGVASVSGDDVIGLVIFLLFALPLPVVTAALAGRRTVAGWVAAGGA